MFEIIFSLFCYKTSKDSRFIPNMMFLTGNTAILFCLNTTHFIFCLLYQGNCVEMLTDSRHAGKWHNIRCNNKRAYVCEAPKGKNNHSDINSNKWCPVISPWKQICINRYICSSNSLIAVMWAEGTDFIYGLFKLLNNLLKSFWVILHVFSLQTVPLHHHYCHLAN